MKSILITGSNSYIGKNFQKWLEKYSDQYKIEKISLQKENWKNKDFSIYDTVIHLAGLAHASSKPNLKEHYYKINRDLTIAVAKKAKNEGVNQFVFMSSIIVYGNSALNKGGIDDKTIPYPSDFYGDSKLQAEKGIKSLEDNNFKIVIIRPPMIYGKNSKGNYPKLAKIAKKSPVFPNLDNKRSVLHIDNLSEFLRLIIENKERGTYFPQNKEYVSTSEMVTCISNYHNKKIILTKMFNPLIKVLRRKIKYFNKIFGNLFYEQNISEYKQNYIVKNLRESIKDTEEITNKKVK